MVDTSIRALAKDTSGEFTIPVRVDDPSHNCQGCGQRHGGVGALIMCLEAQLRVTRRENEKLKQAIVVPGVPHADFARNRAESERFDRTRG